MHVSLGTDAFQQLINFFQIFLPKRRYKYAKISLL